MTNTENTSKIKHLYERACFGLSYTELQKLSSTGINQLVDNMIAKAKIDEPITVLKAGQIKALILKDAEIPKIGSGIGEDQLKMRKELLKNLKSNLKLMNIEWISRMIYGDNPFREKMTMFWSNHFACRDEKNPYFVQELNNIHRKYALGDFRTLLIAVSKSAAMLDFLNNQQNVKGSPNENFARELMELFTLGRGNYTEDDIKQSARAFTGWKHDENGDFQFRKKFHDDGAKTFFGKTGNFGGEDIIDMILQKPEAARFISRKLYKFFVNDTPNETHVNELADAFFKSNYDIATLVRRMFTSDWFYADENTGNKIKSPVEFIVGFSKQFGVTYQNPDLLVKLQDGLGQTLFYPPNVAGWAGGRNWIDGSSLFLRIKITTQILKNSAVNFKAKVDPNDQNLVAVKGADESEKEDDDKKGDTNVNWDKFFQGFPSGFSTDDFASFLLQCPASAQLKAQLKEKADKKTIIIRLIGSPEFQLC